MPEAQASAAFISYCREDSEFALRLAHDLKDAGASVWIDQLDIAAGQLWDNAIEDALIASPLMLLILSPSSARSNNVRNEISFALEQGKTIIPVLYRDCTVPLQLQRANRIDLRADYARGLGALLASLNVSRPNPEVLHDATEAEAKRKAAWQAREVEAQRLQKAEEERQLWEAARLGREVEVHRLRDVELHAQQMQTERISREEEILPQAEALSVAPSFHVPADAGARAEQEPISPAARPWYKRTAVFSALAGTFLALLVVVIVLTHSSRRTPSEPSSSKATAITQQANPPNTSELKPQPATGLAGAKPELQALSKGSSVGQSSQENPSVETELQSKRQTVHNKLEKMISRKQYRQAIPIAKEACSKGDLRSCVDAGEIYEHLNDDSKAVGMYRTGCDGGEPHGCESLAYMYGGAGRGGLPRDMVKRAALLSKACDGGDIDGCSSLANAYLGGEGVAKSDSQAIPYLRKACTGAYSSACRILGEFYEQGKGGLLQDYRLAAPLLQKSASLEEKFCDRESKAHHFLSCYSAGNIYKEPAVQNYSKAIELFRKACDIEATCFPLADMWMQGEGVPQNAQEAISILSKACDLKQQSACSSLAQRYERGWGGIQDKAQAHRYYLKECALPDPGMTETDCNKIRSQSVEPAANLN